MFSFSSKKLAMLLIIIILPLLAYSEVEDVEEEDEENDLEEEAAEEDVLEEVDMVVDSENSTRPVDRSDEEWVKYAVLDVAYYLRAHKFNDYDRRYYKEAVEESYQYKHFPNPPLRYLHWEVFKHCDKGFYDCLEYLQSTVLKAELVRSLDTSVVMNERRWEFPRNAKSIEQLNKECLRLKTIDWRDADPFKGPLERFQWRVSASYYMCSFTMQNLSPLTMFGERCDNFASCLVGKTPFNNDPRADDSEPYQCAKYSFCPEVCCPLKQVAHLDECLDYNENPCFWQDERSKRECAFDRGRNLDLNAMALNQWNVSCRCGPGYEWMSMFGSCVDVDECSAATHNCTPVSQTCLNLQGQYACACAWGYVNTSGTCVHSDLLSNAMAALHQHYHAPPAAPLRPFSLSHFLFKWTFGLFLSKEVNNGVAQTPDLVSNDTDDLIDLNPDE